jgi:hypothetical protein
MAPSAELAETVTAREHWHALERVLLILTEEGHLDFATAVAWLASPDEALDGMPCRAVGVARPRSRAAASGRASGCLALRAVRCEETSP